MSLISKLFYQIPTFSRACDVHGLCRKFRVCFTRFQPFLGLVTDMACVLNFKIVFTRFQPFSRTCDGHGRVSLISRLFYGILKLNLCTLEQFDLFRFLNFRES